MANREQITEPSSIHVIHVTEDFSANGGGVYTSLIELARNSLRLGLKQSIFTPDPAKTPIDLEEIVFSFQTTAFGKPWRHSLNLTKQLAKIANQAETIIHIHGAWMSPQLLAGKISRTLQTPCIISPHNMLGSWFWRQGMARNIKKSLYWNLLSKKAFERHALMHALTQFEAQRIKELLPKNRIEVIPNAIDIGDVDNEINKHHKSHNFHDSFGDYFLFLGRLHPVKGIEILLDAYSSLPKKGRPQLVIAGPPHSSNYLSHLRSYISKLDIEQQVSIIGPVDSSIKWTLLKSARAVCAPSFSEGMSMVALEAMAAKVPLITTYEAGIHDVSEGGGYLVTPTQESIRFALSEAMQWEDRERVDRGLAARRLVERSYSWQIVGTKWKQLYSEVNQ
ncbi:D-inositol 3-phosphate glycosyltransferase [compost metagenome]